MKKLLSTTFFILLFVSVVFGQWQGSGTQQDPYKIFTLEDLEAIRVNEIDFNYYPNIHFELQNDINDSVSERIAEGFYGYFHGKGFAICLNLVDTYFSNNNFISELHGYMDSITFKGAFLADYSLFPQILETGVLSDIIIDLHVITTHEISLSPLMVEHDCQLLNINNMGIIKDCINNSDINVSASTDTTSLTIINIFSEINMGKILNCTNIGNINITTNSLNTVFIYMFSGYNLNEIDGGYIGNCINNGNININGVAAYCELSVFSYISSGKIVNCINNGNITAKQTDVCGIFAGHNGYLVSNCLNTGSIIGEKVSGGIVGENVCAGSYNFHGEGITRDVINCMNTGNIGGNSEVGGIIGKFYCDTGICAVVKNNLNLHKTSGYGIFGDTASTFTQIAELSNNYYDKQVVTQQATVIGDIPGIAEGKLTSQLIGTSPELQAMLGDGWSYAEGRYPIPLGLENHPAALLAATPIYLPYEDTENYNTVDSITCHFTLGNENGVTWESNPSKILIEDNGTELKGILQSTGYSYITAFLDNYSKSILLNTVSICEPNDIETLTASEIEAYPNPANEIIYFNKTLPYKIYDLQGKLVLQSDIPENFVNVRGLKSGIYFIKIGEEMIKFVVE